MRPSGFRVLFFSFSVSFLGCSKSVFFGLNCCTISGNISFNKISCLTRLGVFLFPFHDFFDFFFAKVLSFFVFLNFIFFSFFFYLLIF